MPIMQIGSLFIKKAWKIMLFYVLDHINDIFENAMDSEPTYITYIIFMIFPCGKFDKIRINLTIF